jgi:hypothetical protein
LLSFFLIFFSAGNFVGQPLYTNGTACSACPDGTRCTRASRGLCIGTPRNPQKGEDVNIIRKDPARPQNDGNGNKVADQIRIDPARPQKDGDGNKVADLNLIRKDPAPPQKDGDGNKIADLIRIEPARPQDPCLLNTPTGRCFRALPRFYFDKNFKDCSMFWYGGKVKFFSFHYNNNKGFYDFIVY